MGQFVHKFAPEHADGINAAFTIPEPFIPGTLRLCINGRVYLDGWLIVEHAVEIADPPRVGDVVSFFYQQV